MKKRHIKCIHTAVLMLLILTGCNQERQPAQKEQATAKKEQETIKREISGTVYTLTAGAETIRLPMVEIVAFDIATNEAQKIIEAERLQTELHLDELGKSLTRHYALVSIGKITIQSAREAHYENTKINNFVEDTKTNLTLAIGEWENWQRETQPASYGNKAYERMGKPVQLSTTDVEGKFRAQIRKTDVLLAATAQRQTPGGAETYFWLISIPAGSEKINVELNNKTLLKYSSETQLMIQKTTAEVSKMRSEIEAWLSGTSVR
jgi:hypothetical protein